MDERSNQRVDAAAVRRAFVAHMKLPASAVGNAAWLFGPPGGEPRAMVTVDAGRPPVLRVTGIRSDRSLATVLSIPVESNAALMDALLEAEACVAGWRWCV